MHLLVMILRERKVNAEIIFSTSYDMENHL